MTTTVRGAMAACFLAGAMIGAVGQSPARERALEDEQRTEADLDRRIGELRKLQDVPHVLHGQRIDHTALRMMAEKINKERQPDPEDVAKYRPLLKQFHGGLVRLLADHDCATRLTIRVDDECADFVDGVSAYSFRARQYGSATDIYNDIRFDRGLITSRGFLEHALIASLGDVPVESVSVDHPAVKEVLSLAGASTPGEALFIKNTIAKGVTLNGIEFKDSVEPVLGPTYLMRVIAYRATGIDFRGPVEPTTQGFKYMMLAYDKRADLTLVFRVVRIDPIGNITLLWRELERRKAPSLNFKTQKPKKPHGT